MESHTVLVGCSASDTVTELNFHSVRLSREDLAATRLMKPFWTSTGLCPPEPRNASGAFLLSKDSLTNLELIGSLPNRGISYVRIHWLLELLEVSEERNQFKYNFTTLDLLLDHMHNIGLYPGFELMGLPKGFSALSCTESFWTDLVQQLVERYTDRYGVKYVAEWRYETWNEPDIRSYNLLNFTVNDYLSYIFAVRKGLNVMNQRFNGVKFGNVSTERMQFPLYGPAGLFKSLEHHPFCWSALEVCNSNSTLSCPFDTITYHRKGDGRWASEVLDGGRLLLEDVLKRFPNLKRLMFANDEADPIASWSTGRSFQADVRYAAMLFSIVTQHWSAIANGDDFGQRLLFLSHDNAFLSYYPYVFEQRTLFARFQMNLTNPPHVQFVIKPVFSALGMLANLAPLAGPTHYLKGNVSYLASVDEHMTYLCLVASRSNDSFPLWEKRSHLNVSIPTDMLVGKRLSYVIEAIQDGRNDPFRLWQLQGKPPFPTIEQFAAMREVQLPSVLGGGCHIRDTGPVSNIKLSLNLLAPWIVSVRVCSEDYGLPGQVKEVRVRMVYRDDVLIHWKLSAHGIQDHRCVQTYEVWFKPSRTTAVATGAAKRRCKWCMINHAKHTPFMFYQYANYTCSGVVGYYKVRAIDLFGRKGPFSTPVRYNDNGFFFVGSSKEEHVH
uniref:Alpha-L-iduronidase n=1 Tax=Anopheles christyi TaxID=43041 RepID=A0A182JPX5_9DIPT